MCLVVSSIGSAASEAAARKEFYSPTRLTISSRYTGCSAEERWRWVKVKESAQEEEEAGCVSMTRYDPISQEKGNASINYQFNDAE